MQPRPALDAIRSACRGALPRLPFTYTQPRPQPPSRAPWGPNGGHAYDVLLNGQRVGTITREAYGHPNDTELPGHTVIGYRLITPSGSVTAAGSSDLLLDILSDRLRTS